MFKKLQIGNFTSGVSHPASFPCQARRCSGQAMVEYVIALFLCALVAAGTFKMYQSAMRVHFNKVAGARTGIIGMHP
ncbi:MAG: hypothetical protein ABIH68_07555 [bacterium]